MFVERFAIPTLFFILMLVLSSCISSALASPTEGCNSIGDTVTVISLSLDFIPRRVIVGCNGGCVAVVYGVDSFEGFDLFVFNGSGCPRWVGGVRLELPWHRVFVGSDGIYVLKDWVYEYNVSRGVGFLTLYIAYADLHRGRTSMQVYTIAVKGVRHVKQVGIAYAINGDIYVYVSSRARGTKLYMLTRGHVYSVDIPSWQASLEHVSGWGRVLLVGNYYVLFGESTSVYSLPKIGGRHVSCGVGRGGLLICYTKPTTITGYYSVNVYAIDPVNQVVLDSEILMFRVKPLCNWHDDAKFLVCIGDSIYVVSGSRDGLQTTKYKFDFKMLKGAPLAANLLGSKRLYLVFAGNRTVIHPKLTGTQGLVLAVASERECWSTMLWPNSRIIADSVHVAGNVVGVAMLDSRGWKIVVEKLPSSPPKKLVGMPKTATLYVTVTKTLVKASIVTITETTTKIMLTTTTLYHTVTQTETITKTVTSWKTLTTTKTFTQTITKTTTEVKLLTTTRVVVPLGVWETGIGALVAGLLAGYIVARRSTV